MSLVIGKVKERLTVLRLDNLNEREDSVKVG